MDDLFDDPGDLGFMDLPEDGVDIDIDLDNLFYEQAPGEAYDDA